ncbi:MAG TPA: preprotein translocase subunit SecY [Gemmatimonadaceae bacterium]|jgi:preprotein translocase subunit SecY|nr:preprotein translocase subunit SecY [Gemmatimonadaceae bacterium]
MAQANPAAAIANVWKTTELKDKILFTLLCLVIYRLGAHITAPGIDVVALTDFFSNQGKGGLLGLYDLFVGGGLSKATVFALGIMPYISASIFIQIAGAVIPQVDKMQKDEEGRKKLTQYTRYITVALAIVQAYGFALFTESLQGAVLHPGLGFRIQMVLFLTTGAVFVMWLGEQITERGVGNGASLIIFFSIVERFWPGIFDTVKYVNTGATNVVKLLVLGVLMVGVVAGVVAITIASRKVPIQIPQRTMARGRMREAAKNFIPLKINSAGVMPIIFAQSVVVVPGAIAQFSGLQAARDFAEYFQPTSILYFVLEAVLIVFFTYFYTSIIFNPIDLAENLKKQGGFIPGVKPGTKTAEYIDEVMSRITLPGALFLTFIALLPSWIIGAINVPFRFGGTSLLIVVGVALDTISNMNQHLLLRKYDGFMKKGRIRARGSVPTPGGY